MGGLFKELAIGITTVVVGSLIVNFLTQESQFFRRYFRGA